MSPPSAGDGGAFPLYRAASRIPHADTPAWAALSYTCRLTYPARHRPGPGVRAALSPDRAARGACARGVRGDAAVMSRPPASSAVAEMASSRGRAARSRAPRGSSGAGTADRTPIECVIATGAAGIGGKVCFFGSGDWNTDSALGFLSVLAVAGWYGIGNDFLLSVWLIRYWAAFLVGSC